MLPVLSITKVMFLVYGINVASGAVTNAQEAGIAVKTAANQQALCRPMITIFK